MNPVYTYDQLTELDRLHRAAIVARRAYHLAREARSLGPVFPFHLARDYQVASKALAEFVRSMKQQVTA